MLEVPYSSIFSVPAGESFVIKGVPFLVYQQERFLTSYSFLSGTSSITLHLPERPWIFYDYHTFFPHVIIPQPAEVPLLYSMVLDNLAKKQRTYLQKLKHLHLQQNSLNQIEETYPELFL